MGSKVAGEVTRLSLNLKRDPEVQHLILLYVAMILNHHRLCQHQHHPHLPLNLIELFQATQQIGAFQVRVRQSLSQVLFTSFHGVDFWDKWGQWMFGLLQAWNQTIPEICLTPGLLPLQPGSVSWSWQETVVIQAMALEAAHQLVETLPLSAESLEMLLGLQDALVEDSSTIDPKGFEMVPLGLPFLPHDLGAITTEPTLPDPAIQHLPQILVRISPGTPQMISGPQILCHWLWEMMRQFGPEVSTVGLILVAKMGQMETPWQGELACEGASILTHFTGEHNSRGQGLRTLVRRLALIQHSTIRWQEQHLHLGQMQLYHPRLWQLDALQMDHTLAVAGQHGDGSPFYQSLELESVHFSIAPGPWSQRLDQLYGETGSDQLIQFSQMATQLLHLSPIRQRLATQVALFLMVQFWRGESQHWTIRTLLEAVEPPERIQALASNSMRRDSFFQEWAMMLTQFQKLGWQIFDNPLRAWEEAPLHNLDWLEESLEIQLQAQQHSIMPIGSASTQSMPRFDPEPAISPVSIRRMDQISSRALERALATRGMSQAKLARSLQLDRSTINRWINGSRPIHPRYRPALWALLGPELQES